MLKDLPLGTLISIRTSKDFQNSIKPTMGLLKLAVAPKTSQRIHTGFQNFAWFH